MPHAAGLYYTLVQPDSQARPPLVLIHGAGGTQLHWPPVIRKMAAAPVFAVDLPGHGKSDGAGRQSIPDYAAALLAWMDEVGMGPAVLAGHSMGGAIALHMALEEPARVAGLILVGTGARLRVDPALLEATEDDATYPRAVADLVKRSFGPGASLGLKRQAQQRMQEVRRTVLRGDLLACNQFDVMGRSDGITVPARVVCGTADEMTPLKYSEQLCARILGAELITVEGAGHMVMLERPADVLRGITTFLDVNFPDGS